MILRHVLGGSLFIGSAATLLFFKRRAWPAGVGAGFEIEMKMISFL